jgi:t-SNARE complex subunit (syntaxin)
MKFCGKHLDLLTGEGECFQCQINELRQEIEEYQNENRELKKALKEANSGVPQGAFWKVSPGAN